ncbi:hypothetical protein ABN266_22800, partial [Escherichia coli]|uniref:hypothetical protein n=1 Tax=Escherichia coli TaxID=562 RepID=UPI0032DB39AC
NQESRLPPGSDFRRWVWITIAPFVTIYIRAWLMQPFIPSASQGHGGVFLPGTQWKVCRFWDGMRLPFHQV